MSICAAVFTPQLECPENLKSFNEDGSRIDPDDEQHPRRQSELGSQKVLKATLEAAEIKREKLGNVDGTVVRKESKDSVLSGETLWDDQGRKKKSGLTRRMVGHSSGKQSLYKPK